jgi:hypothetical protein
MLLSAPRYGYHSPGRTPSGGVERSPGRRNLADARTMTKFSSIARLLVGGAVLAWGSVAVTSTAAAEDKVILCHAGLITLPSFAQHIANLRKAKRYSAEDIDALIARNRKGGPEFFSSQIIVQENPSGSGTYDLRLVHGLSDATYRNVTAWACEGEDYPIVYFVGFRVRKIEDGAIFVSREKDVVNVISLKALDPKLDKHIKVKLTESDKILCQDIGDRCDAGIFHDAHEY